LSQVTGFGIAVFGRFPAKIHREMPKNRPKRKLNQSKGESKWSQVTVAESTVEMVQYYLPEEM
jgi:hypothetical protein